MKEIVSEAELTRAMRDLPEIEDICDRLLRLALKIAPEDGATVQELVLDAATRLVAGAVTLAKLRARRGEH
jgi:hypothetical protein